jgi:hypothetical protein
MFFLDYLFTYRKNIYTIIRKNDRGLIKKRQRIIVKVLMIIFYLGR